MPTSGSSPTARQRRVARRLRDWRTRAGVTLDVITTQLNWSKSKLSKFERAEHQAGPAEIIALAAMYRVVSDDERDQTVNLAIKSMSAPGWWVNYAPDVVPNYLADYLETEAEATGLRSLQTLLIPGLLQTAAYIDAVVRSWVDESQVEVVAERRKVRQQRQARLDKGAESPLSLHAVIHESALRIPVGGQDVMREQLDYLLEREKQPNITIQVLPCSAGAYPRAGTAYTLLDLDKDPAAAVFMDNLNGGLLVEETSEIANYTENFRRVTGPGVALDPKTSTRFITETRHAGWPA